MSHVCDEQYDVYDETRRRARTAHVCAACKEPIAPGHEYASIRVVFDGTAETIKRCLRCQVLHEHLRDIGDGDMWPDERLNCGEVYEEHWNRSPPPEIAELAFLTREEIQARFAKRAGAR